MHLAAAAAAAAVHAQRNRADAICVKASPSRPLPAGARTWKEPARPQAARIWARSAIAAGAVRLNTQQASTTHGGGGTEGVRALHGWPAPAFALVALAGDRGQRLSWTCYDKRRSSA